MGALGRLLDSGQLVQVNAGVMRTLDQRAASTALLEAQRETVVDEAARLRQLIEQGGFSQRGAARELGISERMMRYYCAGTQPVPRVVMLAIEHLVTCPPDNQREPQ